jgi:phosphoribosylaminoimidazolecarboxamide formyltransferase / IMP cyclohydrolase
LKKCALISVYDKEGIVEFAKNLIHYDFEIVSTSGTAKLLQDNGIAVTPLEKLTSFPEILNGRVKTLHPLIFAAILADKGNKAHTEEINKLGILPINLVVVNLYPFEETIAKANFTVEQAIEQIDIGGVSLIRAAAKNHKNVSTLVKPSQYEIYKGHLEKKINLENLNTKLAYEAFEYISHYDSCISEYFSSLTDSKSGLSDSLSLNYPCSEGLRYGENPHQASRLYIKQKDNFNSIFEKLHGKELSYNNLLDINSAYNLIKEFSDTSCAIIKHTNPCGISSDEILNRAYTKALSTDSVSAFGGIIIVNKQLDYDSASEMDKIFIEVIIAPSFHEKALELLKKKKNRRLIKYNPDITIDTLDIRSISGGLLVQEPDEAVVNEKEIKCVTKRSPSEKEYKDLIFAMKAAKHTKSNSVVYAKNLQTLGIGGGQPSRVESSNLAVAKALRYGFDLHGSAVASDAFFPFADGVIAAAEAGAKAVIQPGGSVRDDEVISAANEHGLAMLFTGIRHFKH